MNTQREWLAEQITEKLTSRKEELAKVWLQSRPVRHLILDNLLPEEIALRISQAFPPRTS